MSAQAVLNRGHQVLSQLVTFRAIQGRICSGLARLWQTVAPADRWPAIDDLDPYLLDDIGLPCDAAAVEQGVWTNRSDQLR
jgi:hypothetical protein